MNYNYIKLGIFSYQSAQYHILCSVAAADDDASAADLMT